MAGSKKFNSNPGEWRSTARYGKHFRCNICETTKGAFFPEPDPTKSGYVCAECKWEINDVKHGWEIEDELREQEEFDLFD